MFALLETLPQRRKSPNPLFDTAFFTAKYPESIVEGQDPLVFYVRCGLERELWPNPLFDASHYLTLHPEVRVAGINPLSHYITHGSRSEFSTHPHVEVSDLRHAVGRTVPPEALLAAALKNGVRPKPATVSAAATSTDADLVLPRLLRANHLAIPAHQCNVSIVVAVHNALEDVRRCLSSILRHTFQPYELVVVDDGSANETRDFLREFCHEQAAILVRHEEALGYTCAANAGMRRAGGEVVVLLNSDTIVTLIGSTDGSLCRV